MRVDRNTVLLFTLALLAMASFSLGETEAEKAERAAALRRDAVLQKNFDKFPRVKAQTADSGEVKFQTLELNKQPVMFDGERYDGFRFTVKRNGEGWDKIHQALVWACVMPPNSDRWYIVARVGRMNGFENYWTVPKEGNSLFEHLIPESNADVTLQSLAGRSLVEEEDYVIWFRFTTDAPARISVALRFCPLETETADSLDTALQGKASK